MPKTVADPSALFALRTKATMEVVVSEKDSAELDGCLDANGVPQMSHA